MNDQQMSLFLKLSFLRWCVPHEPRRPHQPHQPHQPHAKAQTTPVRTTELSQPLPRPPRCNSAIVIYVITEFEQTLSIKTMTQVGWLVSWSVRRFVRRKLYILFLLLHFYFNCLIVAQVKSLFYDRSPIPTHSLHSAPFHSTPQVQAVLMADAVTAPLIRALNPMDLVNKVR